MFSQSVKAKFRHRRRAWVVLICVALAAALLPAGAAYADSTSEPAAPAEAAAPAETAALAVPASNLPGNLTGVVVGISPVADSTRFLDIGDSSRAEGAPVTAVKNDSGLKQRFQIRPSDGGTYIIRSTYTGRLVTEQNGKIVQTGMKAATDDSQRWAVTKEKGGYAFTNAATGNRLSVSKSSVTPTGGTTNITKAQIFKIKRMPTELDGYYRYVTASGNAIALKSKSIKDGAALVLKKSRDSLTENRFFMTASKTGYHSMKSSISFKAVSVKTDKVKSGIAIVQRKYEADEAQRFKPVPSGDGYYLLRNPTGTYVSAASDVAGAALKTTTDRKAALKFRIVRAAYSSGNDDLDKALKKIHRKIGSKGSMLRKSFRYVTRNYRHKDHDNDFSGDWITRYAWYMVSKKHGHCKNYASALCVLFRSYGYDARVVTGYVPSRSRGWAVHGWVEAKVGGRYYVFDADLQVQLGGSRRWFKTTYKGAPLKYRVGKRW